MPCLRALIVITNTEAALVAKTMGPKATKVNTGLGELSVGEEEPEAEDWLSENIENSVSHDLLVDAEDARSVGYTPDDWIRSPDEESVERNGSEEFANLA